MDKITRFLERLALVIVLVCVAVLASQVGKLERKEPEFKFKGKQYVLAGLQGAGYTHEHRSPVYTLVVMSKEDSKKWTKK